MTPFLEVRNLSRSFGRTRALDQVSVAISPGAIHGFIGPNGSGKSTLIRMITGLERPDVGEIFVGGEPQPRLTAAGARRLGIELVPQELALVPLFKVWENIVLGGEDNAIRLSKADATSSSASSSCGSV